MDQRIYPIHWLTLAACVLVHLFLSNLYSNKINQALSNLVVAQDLSQRLVQKIDQAQDLNSIENLKSDLGLWNHGSFPIKQTRQEHSGYDLNCFFLQGLPSRLPGSEHNQLCVLLQLEVNP